MAKTITLTRNAERENALMSNYPNGDAPSLSLSISGISGTWAEGNTLTITGAAFGAVGPTVVNADNFYGKTHNQAPSESDPQIGTYADATGRGIYDNAYGLGGNVGYKYIDVANGYGPTGAGPQLGIPGAADSIRVAAGISSGQWQGWFPFRNFYLYTAGYATHTNYNVKDYWLMIGNRGDATGNAADGEGHDLYFAKGAIASNNNTFDPVWYHNTAGDNTANAWNYRSWQTIHGADPQVDNCTFKYRGHTGNGTGETQAFRVMYQNQPDPPPWHDRLKCAAYSKATSSDGTRHWGAIYFAISDELSGSDTYAQCRVEFFDGPDADSATVFGVLPPTSWSNTSITVNCWTLGVDANDVYVRVCDKDDNRSALFKLT